MTNEPLMTYPDAIDRARLFITTHRQKGTKCPVCLRNAKIYSRHINATMGRVLISMRNSYQRDGSMWLPMVEFIASLGDLYPPTKGRLFTANWQKLRFWGMVEAAKQPPTNGAKHAGLWMITKLGLDFAENRIEVPYTAYEYRSEVLGFDQRMVGIKDALKKHFNYDELMRGA